MVSLDQPLTLPSLPQLRSLRRHAGSPTSPTQAGYSSGYVYVPAPQAASPRRQVQVVRSPKAVARELRTLGKHFVSRGAREEEDTSGELPPMLEGLVDDVTDKVEEKVSEMREMTRLTAAGDVAEVRFLGQKLHVDSDHATWVLVFPRGDPAGPVEMQKLVHNPREKALSIFVRQHNHASKDAVMEGLSSLDTDVVTQGHYQKVVRRKLLTLFQKSGFKVTTFESIDKDEVFAKIYLDRRGEVIKDLAQRFSYRMPFSKDAYVHVRKRGLFEDTHPPERGGKPVFAYASYQKDLTPEGEPSLFAPFREVDAIRLMEMQMNSWVSLEQLKRQGVIASYFPVATHVKIKELHEEWLSSNCVRKKCDVGNLATVLKVLELPSLGTKNSLVRNFFGEEITFFFRWHAFYSHMLCWLGVLGAALHIAQGISIDMRRHVQILCSFLIVVWATIFNQLFINRQARARQDWGMQDYEDTFASSDRSNYNPELEGTKTQQLKRFWSCCICVFFCCTFIAMIYFIEDHKRTEKMHAHRGSSDGFFASHGSFTVVAIIKVWSFAWGYIAPVLAEMQNHRTKERFDNALTYMLAFVKIFVTLWNFVYASFVKWWTSPTCGANFEEVATQIWTKYNFTAFAEANRTMADLAVIDLQRPSFSYPTEDGVCAYGCYPATPELAAGPGSETNCFQILRYDLVTFFFVHILSTLVFLVYPMIKVKWDMFNEIRKADEMDGDGKPGSKRTSKQYSWLQYQAKCPPYEYGSWGGSRVEDFLECAIGYALLTSFGILYPALCLFAFLGTMVEHRLLAYRMAHVTQRPQPSGASGIGAWQKVFEYVSNVAVVVNVLLLVFVMFPIKGYDGKYKLMFFIVLEHALLAVRAAIDQVIPDCPHDVKRIEDFNNAFKSTMVRYKELEIPRSEMYEEDYLKVDLALHREGSLEPDWHDMCGREMDGDSGDGSSASADGQSSSLEDDEDNVEEGTSPWCNACRKQPQPSVRPL